MGSNGTNRRKQEKNSLIFAAAQAVHALLLILAVKVFAPVCTGMVDTAAGKQVPMRCHYTAVLLLFLGLILLVNAGLCAVRREMAVCGAITAVLSALAFAALSSSAGTGICLNPEMACHVTDQSDFDRLDSGDYPILSDLYAFIEEEYRAFDAKNYPLYTAEMLQSILLGLNSMCVGAESKFFNGHTNITDDSFITFGVKGLLQASRNLKDALLFNVLSFMSDELLTQGNTAASLDEFYLFLSNLTAVEYVRNFMKRVRKKDSAVIIASQNLEDFNLDGVKEYTKPLFSIPTHQFLFNAGSIDAKFYTDTLQLEESEYNLIRYPQRGVCLYKCGNERYNLMVHAPEHKAKLFGKAGGR